MFKIRFPVLVLLLVSTIVVAEEPLWKQGKCPQSVEELARELLELEFIGARLGRTELCLKEAKLRYIQATSLPEDENSEVADVIVEDNVLIKILGIKKIDDYGQYRAQFKIYSGETNKKTFQDEFSFITYKSLEKIKKRGCADFISFPERIYVKKRCLGLENSEP